ncbi:MAG: hypothetical protein V4543_09635 [Bacteroidota bacterium]
MSKQQKTDKAKAHSEPKSVKSPPLTAKEVIAQLTGFADSFPEADTSVHKALTERFIPLRFTGVTSRVFNSWKLEGVIDYPEPPVDRDRERVILSIPEYLWLRLVSCLRLFNVRNAIVLELKAQVFQTLTKDEYLKASKEADPNLRDEKIKTNNSPLDAFLPPAEAGGAIGHLLLIMLQTKIQIDLLVYPTGESLTMVNKDYSIIPAHLKGAPIMLQIDFSTLVIEMIALLFELGRSEEYGLLTENEKEILDIMHSGKAESITIQVDKGEPVSYSWKASGNVQEEDIYNVIRHLKTNPYGSIVLKTNNNKSIFYEAEHKKKL